MKDSKFYLFLIVLLVLAILYLRYCNSRPAETIERVTVKRDTVYQLVRDSSGWTRPRAKVIIKRDSLMIPVTMPVDSAEWLRLYYNAQVLQEEFFVTRFYEDTTRTRYGNIITRDTITENRITAHQVITQFNIPTITETITVQAPRRAAIFAGLGVLGGRTDFIRGFEGTLSLKTKSDEIYEIGGVMLNDGNLYMKAAIKFKLSLKKKAR